MAVAAHENALEIQQKNMHLSLITIFGCSISVVALILTIVFYALTWKKSKSAQATVLLNLCVALIIDYIIFLAGFHRVDTPIGCKIVAVLLHYFFLAAFFLMLAEGVQLLLYTIFVFHVRRKVETIKLVATAWVLPLIIVAVSLATQFSGYGTRYAATLWNLAVTCPVLGLGWLIGFFATFSSSVFFEYLFTIVNSLQGLFIFIFHVLFHNRRMKKNSSTQLTQEQPTKKADKPGFVPEAVQLHEGMERQDNLHSTGTQLASIEDSDTLESTQ